MNPNNHQIARKKQTSPTYKDIIPDGWQKGRTGNCHYVFVDAKGNIQENIADVCFARFTTYGADGGIIKGKFLINQHEKPSSYSDNKAYIDNPIFRKQLRAYINWVVRASPFRWAFRNGRSNFFRDGLSFNCEVSHAYVFGACCAVREGWEFPWRVKYWHQLVKAGVSKELSYYVVSMLGKNHRVLGGQGHSTIQGSPSGKAFDWFRTLTKEALLKIDKPMKLLGNGLNKVSSLFCGRATNKTNKALFPDLKEFLKPYTQGGERYEAATLIFSEKLFNALKEIDNA